MNTWQKNKTKTPKYVNFVRCTECIDKSTLIQFSIVCNPSHSLSKFRQIEKERVRGSLWSEQGFPIKIHLKELTPK